jgi:hypothetical protein
VVIDERSTSMIPLPRDTADVLLAPVVLAVDQQLQQLSGLDETEIALFVVLCTDRQAGSADSRHALLLEALTRQVDTHDWDLSWDPRGLLMEHAGRRVVLGVPPSVASFLLYGALTVSPPRAGRPWPPQPGALAEAEERLAWYAAVSRWAPSKHNSQPWRFVVRDGALEVWVDDARALAVSDPHHREQVIACGAAVHLAQLAARALGRSLAASVLPGTGALAVLVEAGPHATSDLDGRALQAVADRRTDRGPLDATPLPAALPFHLQAAAAAEGATLRLVATPGDRATLARLVERADREQAQDLTVTDELAQWVRPEGDARADGVPETSTRGAAASYRAPYVQRDFSRAGSTAAHDRPGRDEPLVAVLCSPTDQPADWLLTGRALASVLVMGQLEGAHASYLNQPIENPRLRAELRSQLDLVGVPQLVLRLGVGAEVSTTARRSVADVIHRVSASTDPRRTLPAWTSSGSSPA